MSEQAAFNPFPGLRPFRADEDYLFFGREEQIGELLGRLRENRFLAVVGTSGSGKSSLVRAGLIPELMGGTMNQAGSAWEVVLMRPGGNPIENLAQGLRESGLYDQADPDILLQLLATLRHSRRGLVEAAVQSDLEAGANLLVVVDQFEEMFRFQQKDAASEEAAGAFIKLLLEASRQKERPIYVVLTMRSDYLGDCARFSELAEAVNQGEYLIPRLKRIQRKEAIEGPVRVGKAEVAPRLLQRVLNDVGDDPDQLPVLQHALMRTWDEWSRRQASSTPLTTSQGGPVRHAGSTPLTTGQGRQAEEVEGNKTENRRPLDVEDYEAIGGTREALSRHADEVYLELPSDRHRVVTEKLFKALTEKGADNRGIRRPTRLGQLCQIIGGSEEEVVTVVEAFRKSGRTFLMPPEGVPLQKETVLDISHESLMRVWVRLRNWVEEEAQSARIYLRLAETAQLRSEGQAGLFHDPDLQIALSWREANHPDESWARRYHPAFEMAIAFLEESQDLTRQEEREREAGRKRELDQAKALAAAEKAQADVQRRSASRLKVLVGGLALVMAAAVVAMIVAINASGRADREAKKVRNLSYGANLLTATYFTDTLHNGGRALQALTNCPVELRDWEWDYQKARADQTYRLLATGLNGLYTAIFNPAGTHCLSGQQNGLYQLWDLASGKEVGRFEMESADGYQVPGPQFTPDGKKLVLSDPNKITVWDVGTSQPVQSFTNRYPLAVHVSSNAFLSLYLDGSAGAPVMWDHTANQVRPPPNSSPQRDANAPGSRLPIFSSDGKWVAQAAGAGTQGGRISEIRLWDAFSGERFKVIQADHRWSINALAFSQDGLQVASASIDGDVKVFLISGQGDVGKVFNGEGRMYAVALSHDGTRLATGGSRSDVVVWDVLSVQPSLLSELRGHASEVRSLCFSPDDQYILSSSADGSVRLWESGPNRTTEFMPVTRQASSVVFSPDGSLLVSIGRGEDLGVVRLSDAVTGQDLGAVGDPAVVVEAVCYSPDGSSLAMLAVLERNVARVTLWDTSTWQPKFTLEEVRAEIDAIAFHGDTLLGYGADRTVCLWDTATRKLISSYSVGTPEGVARAWAISSDAKLLAVAMEGSPQVQICDTLSGKLRQTLRGAKASITSLAFSPDGQWVAAGASDSIVLIWERASGELIHRLKGHTQAIWSVHFSPSGRRLLTGAQDDSYKLWKWDTEQELMGSATRVGVTELFRFSPDGQTFFGIGNLSTPEFHQSFLPSSNLRKRRAIANLASSTVERLSGQLPSTERVLEALRDDDDLDPEVKRVAVEIATARADEDGSEFRLKRLDQAIADAQNENDPTHPRLAELRAQRFAAGVEAGWTARAREDWEFLRSLPPSAVEFPEDLLRPYSDRLRFEADRLASAGEPDNALPKLHTALLLRSFAHHDSGRSQIEAMEPINESIAALTQRPPPLSPILVATGAVWKYSDQGLDLGTEWRSANYDDSKWDEGRSPLGHGDPVATEIALGPLGNVHVTSYFRHSFLVPGVITTPDFVLNLRRDDGAVVYLNSKEIVRDNMPNGPITAFTFASFPPVSAPDESAFSQFEIPMGLKPGTNLLAVEVHQVNSGSSDLVLDLELIASLPTLLYFQPFSPEEFEAEIQSCLPQLPNSLQGPWAERFHFVHTPDVSSTQDPITSDWRNWDLRARIQMSLAHGEQARHAWETSLKLLRDQLSSPSTQLQIENVQEALERVMVPNPLVPN